MVSGYEITCANKNPNGLLVRIGGKNWSLALQEAILKLSSGQLRLYVNVDGRPADVGISGQGANAYLTVEPDGYPLHQLTDLPSC